MKKRILTMLLALVMLMSILPFSAMAAPNRCNHTRYGFTIEKAEGNCKTESAINYICKRCGELVKSMSQGLGDHVYGADSKCTVCGRVCRNHNYGPKVTVAATCTQDGSVTRTCRECGYDEVKPLKSKGHSFTIPVRGRAATCTVEGYTAHKICANYNCGEENEEYTVIEATGHDYKTYTDIAATCTKNGVLKQVCKDCGYVNEEIRQASGHSYTDVAAKDPTCTEGGHSAYQVCSCGHKKGYVPSAATGHTYVNGKCSCGATAPDYSGPTRPSNPWCRHTSKSTYTISADCTVAGYTVVTCNDCHAEISREIHPAKGHITETIRQEPTCTQDGHIIEICTVCKTRVNRTTLNKLGHEHVNGICTRCGSGDPNKYTSDLQDIFFVKEY